MGQNTGSSRRNPPPLATRWKPGQSGNPGGRPQTKDFATLIRARTSEGKTLIDYALVVLQDNSQRTRDRLQALEWLADRGWGKAVQQTDMHLDGDLAITADDLIKAALAARRAVDNTSS